MEAAARSAPRPVTDRGRVDDDLIERMKDRSAAGRADQGPRTPLGVTAPWTGETLATLPEASGDDVRRAVARAREAQGAWFQRPYKERAKRIARLHDLILDRREEILDLVQLETGKARKDAFEEVADVALVARYYAYHGERHIRSRRRRGALPGLTRTVEHHRPVGVVGFISPWNYPLTITLTDVIPALLAGNGAVLKPDHATPFTALWCALLSDDAGIPPDLFHVIPGDGARIGPDLIGAVDHIAFTGSTATGRIVAKGAGENLIGCSLELGGKNPLIVLDDADLDHAVRGATRGSFSNAGQLCISSERILVHHQLHDDFLDRFARAAADLVLGAGLDYDADMGSLTSEKQLETVRTHLRDAVDKGATIVTGGSHRPDLGPCFFEPTILTGVEPGMEAFDQETFGPLVAVYPFDDDDAAIQEANATRYGLNASIYTRDPKRARRLAARIHTGTVNINDPYSATWASADAPMGGFKDSGVGRRHGAEGIRRYTQAQTVAQQRWVPLGPSRVLPPTRFAAVVTRLLKLIRRIPGLR